MCICVFFGLFGLRCIYHLWVVYVRGRHYVLISFIVSCFTYGTLVIDLYYEAIHGICLILCFVKSRIYFVLLVFSTHAFMYLLSVLGIYKLIQSCYCLYWQLIDSVRLNCFWAF